MQPPLPMLLASPEASNAVNYLADMEAAIVARLVAACTPAGAQYPAIDVVAWPDDPESYRLDHPVGAALVVYQGQTARPGNGGLSELQYTWAVRVMCRTLRQASMATDEARAGLGTYQLMQICKLGLQGFKPQPDCDKMVLRKAQFADQREGVWQYDLTFSTDTEEFVPTLCPPGPWIVEGDGVCCATAPLAAQIDPTEAGAAAPTPNAFIQGATP